MVVVIARRLLGIPSVGYLEDFCLICPISLAPEAMDSFQHLAGICGVRVKKKKSSSNQTDIFVGIEGCMPNTSNGAHLSVRHPAGKAGKWSLFMKTFLTSDAIVHAWLDKVVGILSVAKSEVLARRARSLLGHLYRKLKAKVYIEELSA